MEYRYKLDYSLISRRIKAARKAARLTQAELAEKIGISTNAVAKLETNVMNASLQTLINIANVLDIDINYLLRDTDESGADSRSIDLYLKSVMRDLSPKEKQFIIHTINGLKIYNADGGDLNSIR